MNSNKLIERLEHALDVTENANIACALDDGSSSAANGKKKPRNLKLDLLIRKVLSRGINPHWLLTGEGSMYRKATHTDLRNEVSELQKMERVLAKVYHKLKTVG